MKVQILSDLHLEFADFEIPETDADVIVLAGDIHVGTRAVEWIQDQTNKPVIYILGNHEYYHQAFPKLQETVRDLCEGTNIHFLENDEVIIDGVRFLGATLWSDFNLFGKQEKSMLEARATMNDFRMIRPEDERRKFIKAEDFLEAHNKSMQFLEQALKTSDLPTVVMSHNAPSNRSSEARYKDSALAPAFASNLESFIEQHQPKLWIHGHMHNSSDYMIAETRVICNPRGYEGHELNESFKTDLVVEI